MLFRSLEVREKVGANLSALQEGITGVRVIQAYAREDEQIRRFEESNRALFRSHLHSVRVSTWYFGLIEFSGIASTAFVVGIGGWLVHRGDVSLGTVVAFVLLLRRDRGHPAPMLPLDLLKRPMFALSTATAVCSFAAQGLAFVSLPFYFEHVLGRNPVETGFLLTPWSAVVAVMAPIAGRLSDRYPPGLLGGIGLAIMAVGMASLAMMPADASVLNIGIRMAICGAGFGFFQSPNLKALMASAPRERAGGASGVVATARLLGQATGAALVALSFGIAGEHGPTLALSLGAGFAAAAAVASGLRLVTPQSADSAAMQGARKSS